MLVRHSEGETVCRIATEKLAGATSPDGLRVWARVLAWQSVFERLLGQMERSGRALAGGLALLESPKLVDLDTRGEKAFLLLKMGDQAFDSDRKAAKECYQDSLNLYQKLGDRWGIAYALEGLARVAWGTGDYATAEGMASESLELRRELGDLRGTATSLAVLRQVFVYLGRFEESVTASREALDISERIGDRAGVSRGLWTLAGSLMASGELFEAHSIAEQAASSAEDLGLAIDFAHSCSYIALVEAFLGRYKQAWATGQKALTLSIKNGLQRRVGWNLRTLGMVVMAQGRYAQAQNLLQRAVGAVREIGQRDDAALYLGYLGFAECKLGHRSQARTHLAEAMRIAAQFQAGVLASSIISGIALFLAEEGKAQRAAEIYALASCEPYVANSQWYEDVCGKHIAAVAATLPPDVVAAAQQRGRARDLWETAEELLAELEGEADDA
jgi:tetratricopeptide (TPR) repeat protein